MKRFRTAAVGLIVAIFATSTAALAAQPAAASAYDSAKETTLNGTVQKVLTQHVAGSPAGLHVLVSASQGTVDAHFGPFVSKDARAALHAGAAVQIVGSTIQVKGKQYFLARQLTTGGRTVVIRTNTGFLVHPIPDHVVSKRQSAAIGGAQ